MASSDDTEGLCPNWVLSVNSIFHIARDRSWFSEYTTITSAVLNMVGTDPVVGIGDVDIPVEAFPSGSKGNLQLRSVIHVPSAVCNIISGPEPTEDYKEFVLSAISSDEPPACIKCDHGGDLAWFKPKYSLWCLKISPPPIGLTLGRSCLREGVKYAVHAFWPQRGRWDLIRNGQDFQEDIEGHPETDPEDELEIDNSRPELDHGCTWEEEHWLE